MRRLGGAVLGALVGGLPGALVGALLGALNWWQIPGCGRGAIFAVALGGLIGGIGGGMRGWQWAATKLKGALIGFLIGVVITVLTFVTFFIDLPVALLAAVLLWRRNRLLAATLLGAVLGSLTGFILSFGMGGDYRVKNLGWDGERAAWAGLADVSVAAIPGAVLGGILGVVGKPPRESA